MQRRWDYNVLDRKEYWDSHTRQIIESRLSTVPKIEFFNDREAETLETAVARILPQEREDNVLIVPFIDEKLSRNVTDGTRYEDMPQMRDLWRIFVKALDEEAEMNYEKAFTELRAEIQDKILDAISKGASSSPVWEGLPAQKAFKEIVTVIAMFYYSHPYAWNEVGWGGPKYPEIYVRIGCGLKDPEEPWEVGYIRDE